MWIRHTVQTHGLPWPMPLDGVAGIQSLAKSVSTLGTTTFCQPQPPESIVETVVLRSSPRKLATGSGASNAPDPPVELALALYTCLLICRCSTGHIHRLSPRTSLQQLDIPNCLQGWKAVVHYSVARWENGGPEGLPASWRQYRAGHISWWLPSHQFDL